MGIASEFSKVLHREIRAYAAWPPLTNTLALGDYGLIRGGVFDKLGNIDEFGVKFKTEQGSDAKLNFSSEGTRLVRLVGGADVNTLPDAPIEAKLRVELGRKDSFVAKAATITVTNMSNVRQVAERLAGARRWKRRYRVVRGLWTAQDAAFAFSNSEHAAFELSGNADALKQFELGSVKAGVEVSSEEEGTFTQIGKTGVMGLSLFRLEYTPWSQDPRLLGPPEQVEIEDEDAEELTDDV